MMMILMIENTFEQTATNKQTNKIDTVIKASAAVTLLEQRPEKKSGLYLFIKKSKIKKK